MLCCIEDVDSSLKICVEMSAYVKKILRKKMKRGVTHPNPQNFKISKIFNIVFIGQFSNFLKLPQLYPFKN